MIGALGLMLALGLPVLGHTGSAPSQAEAARAQSLATLHGRVLTRSGDPISQAQVQLGEGSSKRQSTQTRPDGTFEFAVPSGAYTLEVSAFGFVTVSQRVQAPSDEIELRLGVGGELRGVVLDANGAALEGANVSVERAHEMSGDLAEAETDPRGTFEVLGLADGEYTVIATGGGTANGTWAHANVTVSNGSAPRLTLRIGAGRKLVGRVVDEAGHPIPDASVSVSDVDFEDTERARSDRSGQFEVIGLPDGTLSALAVKEGYTAASLENVHAGEAPITLVLAAQHHVRGRVLDPRGVPVPRFIVQGHAFKTSDGRFDLGVDLRDSGHLMLTILAPGFPVKEQEVVLSGAATELGDVKLEDGPALHGMVVDGRSGRPLSGARLLLASPQDASWASPKLDRSAYETGADGTFRLACRPERNPTVVVVLDGFEPRRIPASEVRSHPVVALTPTTRPNPH